MMIAGFILAHFCLLLVLLGLVFPRYYNIFIPPHRRAEGTEVTTANQSKEQGVPDVEVFELESGMPLSFSTRKSSEMIDTKHSTAPKI
jgi:solute carrier family 6 GABA transporter-like protein 1